MPRPSKGLRLWLRPEERAKDGRIVRHAQWIIKGGGKPIPTGCGAGDRRGADQILARTIQQHYAPARTERGLDATPLGDVIAIYLTDVVAHNPLADQRTKAGGRAKRLLAFWGDKTLSEVTGANCRAYAAQRGSDGGARRDLQDLNAAIQHHHREGLHRALIRVWLPPAGERRERWLTRSEIARLVWTAWTMREEMRRVHGDTTAPRLPTAKRTGRHLARAILMAYYTGSRIGDVLNASWHAGAGRSFVDIEEGLFYRRPIGKRATSKRQPPTRLGFRIRAHLRRWRDKGLCASYVVEWEGLPVKSIKTSFGTALTRSKLEGDINRHTMRHSRATHMKQASISSFEVGEALGMSERTVEQTYGHFDPARMSRATNVR